MDVKLSHHSSFFFNILLSMKDVERKQQQQNKKIKEKWTEIRLIQNYEILNITMANRPCNSHQIMCLSNLTKMLSTSFIAIQTFNLINFQ